MDEYNALWTDLAELNDSKNLIWAYQNIPSIIKWQLSISVCIRFSFLPFEKILYLRNTLTKITLLYCIRNVSNIWIWYGKRRSFFIQYSSVQVPFPAISFDFILHRIKLNEVWSNLKLLLVDSIYKKSIIHQKHHYYDTVKSLLCPASAIFTTSFSSPFAKITINSWWFETLYSNPSRLLLLIVSLGMGTKEKKLTINVTQKMVRCFNV